MENFCSFLRFSMFNIFYLMLFYSEGFVLFSQREKSSSEQLPLVSLHHESNQNPNNPLCHQAHDKGYGLWNQLYDVV